MVMALAGDEADIGNISLSVQAIDETRGQMIAQEEYLPTLPLFCNCSIGCEICIEGCNEFPFLKHRL